MEWAGNTGTASAVPPNRRAAHVAFMALLGALGWGVLLAVTYVPGFGPGVVHSEGALAFAVFFFVIVAARSMAVQLVPGTVVSVDSGFYIAAAVALGSMTAGRLVALALTLDSLFRLLGPEAAARRRSGDAAWTDDLVYVLYFGGMSGALLMCLSWLVGSDSFVPGAWSDVELTVMRLVFTIGVGFLIVHYAVQGVRLWLLGQPVRAYARQMVVTGMLTEVALLPLSVVIVLIFRPDQPVGFILLAATYLLMNFVFSQLATRRAELRKRVVELESLNATSRELARSLQLHELVETVARETVRAIPEAELVTLAHRGGTRAAAGLVVECYDRDRRKFDTLRVRADEGATGWVIANSKSLLIPEMRKSELNVGDAGVRSWMGVPLRIYGETEGVLAVQSRERNAFGADELRVLEAIGGQTAVALQNARLYELAMVDGLTSLFVRRYFDARLDEELQRSHRFGTEFSVVMMDIDDFKQLNDTHGHQAGDRVLMDIAQIVKRQMRGVDTAARYGGEEFAMVLPRTSMLDAYNQAERIRELIAAHRVAVGDVALGVTASFGIASYPESGEGTAADIIRRADVALYRAKKTGKNRVELYWGEGSEKHRIPLKTVQ